jgi:hypothetical protein
MHTSNEIATITSSCTCLGRVPVSCAKESIHCKLCRDNIGSPTPFAPLEALLPATRLKLWVDEIYVISKDLSIKTAAAQQRITIQQMNDKLSNPPKLFQGEAMAKRTNNPTAQLTTAISQSTRSISNESQIT